MSLRSLATAHLSGWFAAFALTAGPARAESLPEAIASAYQNNPRLQAQRAEQRIIDESYVQARAGLRPTIGLAANATYSNTGLRGAGTYETNSGTTTLSVSQPLYTGGRVSAAVRAAEADVLAGREALRAAEGNLILNVISAYEDVRLLQHVVEIRVAAITDLDRRRAEALTKFQVGQVTRTDVAQAETQLAQAHSLLTLARAQFDNSQAAYAAVVGHPPADLQPEPELPGMVTDLDVAFTAAESDNPLLRQGVLGEQASRARIAEARAAARPNVAVQASAGYTGPIVPFASRGYGHEIVGSVVLTQPLFAGGVIQSGVRTAVERNTIDRLSVEDTRRNVDLAACQAWNNMQAAHANVLTNQEQVRAARVAFFGIQEEYHLGLSTTFNVLLQQQTLSNAELSLAQSRRDFYVAQATLLNAIGRLAVATLLNGLTPHDPVASFNKVRAAGALPWDGLVERVDAIGAPKVDLPRSTPVDTASSVGVTMKAEPKPPGPVP